jgi:hypothetical protein
MEFTRMEFAAAFLSTKISGIVAPCLKKFRISHFSAAPLQHTRRLPIRQGNDPHLRDSNPQPAHSKYLLCPQTYPLQKLLILNPPAPKTRHPKRTHSKYLSSFIYPTRVDEGSQRDPIHKIPVATRTASLTSPHPANACVIHVHLLTLRKNSCPQSISMSLRTPLRNHRRKKIRP